MSSPEGSDHEVEVTDPSNRILSGASGGEDQASVVSRDTVLVEQCLEAHLSVPLEDDLDLQLFIEDQLSDTEGPHSAQPAGDADLLGDSDPEVVTDDPSNRIPLDPGSTDPLGGSTTPRGATGGTPGSTAPPGPPAPTSVLSAIYTPAKLQSLDPSLARMIARVLVHGCWDAGVEPPVWLKTLSHD